MQTIATIAYHVRNVASVIPQDDMLHYHNIFLLIDEIEVSFHPEYQQKFISELRDALMKQGLLDKCNINITIATHSPFVLSDIPRSNILCLENGESRTDAISGETFAANVYDLLNNQFFMDKFIGDFAEGKIKATIAKLNEWKERQKDNGGEAIAIDPEELNEVRNTIAIIGDRYLKAKMEEKLMRVIAGDNRMKEYKQKVEELKKEYLYDSNKVRFK